MTRVVLLLTVLLASCFLSQAYPPRPEKLPDEILEIKRDQPIAEEKIAEELNERARKHVERKFPREILISLEILEKIIKQFEEITKLEKESKKDNEDLKESSNETQDEAAESFALLKNIFKETEDTTSRLGVYKLKDRVTDIDDARKNILKFGEDMSNTIKKEMLEKKSELLGKESKVVDQLQKITKDAQNLKEEFTKIINIVQDQTQKLFTELGNKIKDSIGQSKEVLKEKFAVLKENVKIIKDSLKKPIEKIREIIKELSVKIEENGQKLREENGDVLEKLNKLVTELSEKTKDVKDVRMHIEEHFKNSIHSIQNRAKEIIESAKEKVKKLKEDFKNKAGDFEDIIKNFGGNVRDIVETLKENAKDKVISKDNFEEFAKKTYEKIAAEVKERLKNIPEITNDIIEKFEKIHKELGTEVGKKLPDHLIGENIKEKIEDKDIKKEGSDSIDDETAFSLHLLRD